MAHEFSQAVVNAHLAQKQCLLGDARPLDVVGLAHSIVALHSTDPTSPYLSARAREPTFQRKELDEALYSQRSLVRVMCMRSTVHAVPTDEATLFVRIFASSFGAKARNQTVKLAAQSGMCTAPAAKELVDRLQREVLDALSRHGPATAAELSESIPELRMQVRYGVGRDYAGSFGLSTRLISSMCAQGLLVRGRPRGSWRSSLYEYATISQWLPEANVEQVDLARARAWLIRRYLAAFGPATLNDVIWWSGLTKRGIEPALAALEADLEYVTIQGLDGCYLALHDDVERLESSPMSDTPLIFLLPSLDPYTMGYIDRRRFLAAEHRDKVYDRGGNGMPTVWVDGRMVGCWGQNQDGSVVYGLFEAVSSVDRALIDEQCRRWEDFFNGEYLPARMRTPFTRSFVSHPDAAVPDAQIAERS